MATRPAVASPAPTSMHAVKRNLAWLLISQAATWLVSVAVLLVVPRIVGDAAFGELSFAIVFVSFVDLLANLGTNTFLVKAIARDESRVGSYLVNAIVMKLLLTAVLVTGALGLGVAIGLPHSTMVLILAYCIGLVINVVGFTIGAALTGLQLMTGLAKWNMIQGYVGGIGSLLVLMNGGTLFQSALVFNIAFLIPIPANLRKLWPYIRHDHAIDVGSWGEILKGGFPFFILAALLVVYGTIDIPLLQAMTSSEEVGWYALAYRWVSVPAFFAATISTAVFPALSAEGVELTDMFKSLANRSLRLAVFVATPAAIGIALVAEPFLTLLYKGQFDQAATPLRILALHIPIVSLDIILGSIAMATDRQRQWVMISVAASVFNPVLNLVAIPHSQAMFGNGAIGAAVVTVLTELILMVGAIKLCPRGVLDRPTMNVLLRMTLASLAMVPVVLLLGDAPLVVLIAAGLLTYAVASFALKTISVAELRSIAGRSGDRANLPHPEASLDDVPTLTSALGMPLVEPALVADDQPPARPPAVNGTRPRVDRAEPRPPKFRSLPPLPDRSSVVPPRRTNGRGVTRPPWPPPDGTAAPRNGDPRGQRPHPAPAVAVVDERDGPSH